MTGFFSALRSAIDKFSFSFFGKTAMRKTGNLSLRQIYTTRARHFSPFLCVPPGLFGIRQFRGSGLHIPGQPQRVPRCPHAPPR